MSTKCLKAVRRIFVDVYHINSAMLLPDDIKYLTAELDVSGDLLIKMPAEIAERLESHSFHRFKYHPLTAIIRSEKYLQTLDVTKEEIIDYINS